MGNISFAKTPGAGSSAPVVTPEPVASEAEEKKPSTALATPTEDAPSNSLGFYTGEEDAPERDPRDERLPRLNLVQGLSDSELKAIGKDGDFVLKRMLNLGTKFTAVVVGFRPKFWIEKLPQYGKGEARYARTLQEVAAFGGTDEWRLSRENKDRDGMPASKKPWFPAHVTGLLLIQRPEGADDAYFPAVTPDGQAFAPALFTVKSTSYGSFFIPINSELRGLFRGHFWNRYVEVHSEQAKKNPSFIPVPKITTETPEAVRLLAKQAVS